MSSHTTKPFVVTEGAWKARTKLFAFFLVWTCGHLMAEPSQLIFPRLDYYSDKTPYDVLSLTLRRWPQHPFLVTFFFSFFFLLSPFI